MSLGIDPHELARLVQAAETAPPDVHELRTDTGVVVRIERDPEPGIEKRLFAPDHPEWEVMLTRATDTRPARYPTHLPFVANAVARATIPANFELHAADRERAIGVRRDAAGVERVVVYRVTR